MPQKLKPSVRKSPVNACSIQSEYIISADEPFPGYHKQAKQLTESKNQYPQLKTVHSQVLQQTLRTLDRAWDDMKNLGFGFPRFKQIGSTKDFSACIKIIGAQWNQKNVPQMLKLRCIYLNGDILCNLFVCFCNITIEANHLEHL